MTSPDYAVAPWPRPRPGSGGTGSGVTGSGGVAERVNRWTLIELTRLNRDILAGHRPAGDFARELTVAVLAWLPSPEALPEWEARQLIVLLGLAGASLGRHYQERDPTHRATPELAFQSVPVGADAIPFRAYFARLADRTATGHVHRDTYASLVRWNLPTSEVWWAGERLAALPGVFDDGQVRTYTGAADERRFFELIKLSETLELAVNAALMPLSDGTVDVRGGDAVRRVGLATVLLRQLRRLNVEFAARPPEESLRPAHFLDVFRQYAVHWEPGDIPPSGALDPEAIARDLLLGIALPGYEAHVRHLFPALLDTERAELSRLLDRPPLPWTVLRLLDLDPAELAGRSPAQLRVTVGRHPVLAALYLLLNANARMSGVHLMLTKKFLFGPQRKREEAGLGDPGVVSNRRGTTGMDEQILEELTRARHHHPLTCLRQLPGRELAELAGVDRLDPGVPDDLSGLVRFATTAAPVTPESATNGPATNGPVIRPRAGAEPGGDPAVGTDPAAGPYGDRTGEV